MQKLYNKKEVQISQELTTTREQVERGQEQLSVQWISGAKLNWAYWKKVDV